MTEGDDATLARVVYAIVLGAVAFTESPLGRLAARMRDEVMAHEWPPVITDAERGMLLTHDALLTKHVTGRADVEDLYAQACRHALRQFRFHYLPAF